MKHIPAVIVFMVFIGFPSCNAQKYLQLEKSGSLKTKRFTIGDEIIFKLKNDDHGWYERVISDIDVEEGKIIFKESVIYPDSIEAIRLDDSNILQAVGLALQVGGANMILFSLYYSIFHNREFDEVTIASALGNILLGQVLRTTLAKRKFKPGKRKRLRLLDLGFWEEGMMEHP